MLLMILLLLSYMQVRGDKLILCSNECCCCYKYSIFFNAGVVADDVVVVNSSAIITVPQCQVMINRHHQRFLLKVTLSVRPSECFSYHPPLVLIGFIFSKHNMTINLNQKINNTVAYDGKYQSHYFD